MPNLLFDPQGNDNAAYRQIWGGTTTNLIQLNNVRYKWAAKLYEQMRNQIWIAHKVDLSTDVNSLELLTKEERNAFKGVLGYLVFLDSIQVNNLPYLVQPITAPEVRICLSEQISQEVEHARSYQYIIETLFSEAERIEIYEYWKNDPILFERCEFIATKFQSFVNDPARLNYFESLVIDYILEGLFFYNGFNFFYALASRGLMTFTKNVIQLINRDEKNHVYLFQNLVNDYLSTNMERTDNLVEWINEMFDDATQHEIAWSQHILGDKVLGMSSHSIEQYTKFRANNLMKNIGFEPLYSDVKNPYKHLEKMADIGADGDSKANFFDSTITSYVQADAVDNWDF